MCGDAVAVVQIKSRQVGSKCSSNWPDTYGTDGINETIEGECVCE